MKITENYQVINKTHSLIRKRDTVQILGYNTEPKVKHHTKPKALVTCKPYTWEKELCQVPTPLGEETAFSASSTLEENTLAAFYQE